MLHGRHTPTQENTALRHSCKNQQESNSLKYILDSLIQHLIHAFRKLFPINPVQGPVIGQKPCTTVGFWVWISGGVEYGTSYALDGQQWDSSQQSL
jgi:hypothetical protein